MLGGEILPKTREEKSSKNQGGEILQKPGRRNPLKPGRIYNNEVTYL
jgi:hypothetical protein